MNILKKIRNCIIFYDFTDKEINKVFDTIDARIIKYSRGQLVAKEDYTVEEVCILLDGNLLAYITKPNGSREVLHNLTDGEIYALEQGYLPPYQLGYNVVSALDSTVLCLKIDSFLSCCNDENEVIKKLVKNIMFALSKKIEELKNNNGFITIKGMRLKIAKLIYEKYLETEKLDISLGMNRNEMAKFLNVSRPSMSREMIRMRDQGMFEFWKDRINIKDLEAIKSIVQKG
ncbi:MAG: Crp/Fnr family transcriptional regulator [Clostridia bacterium]